MEAVFIESTKLCEKPFELTLREADIEVSPGRELLSQRS